MNPGAAVAARTAPHIVRAMGTAKNVHVDAYSVALEVQRILRVKYPEHEVRIHVFEYGPGYDVVVSVP